MSTIAELAFYAAKMHCITLFGPIQALSEKVTFLLCRLNVFRGNFTNALSIGEKSRVDSLSLAQMPQFGGISRIDNSKS